MIDYENTGRKIRTQRKILGLTQEVVSEKVGITPSYFSQIESGTRKAGINTFVSISEVLSISLDYLLSSDNANLSAKQFNDIEYQIFYRLNKFSEKDKKFISNMIILMEKDS